MNGQIAIRLYHKKFSFKQFETGDRIVVLARNVEVYKVSANNENNNLAKVMAAIVGSMATLSSLLFLGKFVHFIRK